MSVTIMTGKISHIDHSTETSGHITANRGGQIQTAHAWSFRLNNRPVTYKSRSTASFSEGDELTAAGENRNGTFFIVSCRNETTGAVYESPATMICVAAGLLIVLGLPMMLLLIGFLLVPLGIYFLMMGLKMSAANKLLQATPPNRPPVLGA